jgi:hypothetical protein
MLRWGGDAFPTPFSQANSGTQVKTQYDPTNQFQLNANVEPRRA